MVELGTDHVTLTMKDRSARYFLQPKNMNTWGACTSVNIGTTQPPVLVDIGFDAIDVDASDRQLVWYLVRLFASDSHSKIYMYHIHFSFYGAGTDRSHDRHIQSYTIQSYTILVQ